MKLQEIARKAGVSTATVSRVFSHHPNVREDVRSHVFAVAGKYGYHPRLSSKMRNIAVIIPYKSVYPVQSYVEMVLTELTHELPARGYRIEILPQENLEQLPRIQFCGAIGIGIDAMLFRNWDDSFAAPLIVINTAIAEQLTQFKEEVDKLIAKGIKKDEAILQIIRKYIIESKNIRFEGNGYSAEWLREAAERGIESIGSVPDAFKVSVRKDAIALFEKHGIFNEAELHARYEINMENLVKKIQIESRVLADLAANHIVPTAIRYQNILIQNVKGLKDILPDEYADMAAEEIRTIRKIARYVKAIRENTYHMVDARKKYNAMDDIVARATGYSEEVQPYLDKIRHDIDKLELIVDDELWPLPKYREMMSIN